MPTSSSQKGQREQAQADADEAATSDTAEVTTTEVVPSTVAGEKAAEAEKAKDGDDEPSKDDPPICVPCFRGVWPGDAHRASCEHGQWERPDPAAVR